jgi:hypothetical protein
VEPRTRRGGAARAARHRACRRRRPRPGVLCQFDSDTNLTNAPGTETGWLAGGPLVLTDSTTHLPGSGTLICRIQVDVWDHTGTGQQIQGHGTGVVTAGPSYVSFTTNQWSGPFLCTEFTDDSDGTTYYWDDWNSGWSTSDRVSCCGPPPHAPSSNPSDESAGRAFCSTVATLPRRWTPPCSTPGTR